MIKKSIKNILSSNIILPFKKGNRFIFTYHDISKEESIQYSPYYSTKPDIFCRHIDFLRRHFSMVSLEQITSDKLDNSRNYAAITFDDGFKSVLEQAAPVLWERAVPFAVFINRMAVEKNRLWLSDLEEGNPALEEKIEGLFGYKKNDRLIEQLKNNNEFNNNIDTIINNAKQGDQVYLNEEDVIFLNNKGVLIGSHTSNHPVISNCNQEALLKEIDENKIYLDRLLNQNTQHFGYPFGKKEHYNDSSQKQAEKCGHHFIYTSNPVSFNTKNFDHKLIPRIGLLNETEREIMFLINRPFLKKIDI